MLTINILSLYAVVNGHNIHEENGAHINADEYTINLDYNELI